MRGSAIGSSSRAVACVFAVLMLAGPAPFGVADVWGQEAVGASPAAESGAIAAFNLVDQHGASVTDEDFRGRFMLVYFGYTYCPDVCPLGLQRMSGAVEVLGPDAEQIVPIFISVDPERDSGRVLAAYTTHFHPRLLGLTGTREQVDAARKSYGVRSFKVFLPPSFDEGESDKDDNSRYLMQHSASTYLVDPGGTIERVFPHETASREMARQIRGLVTGGL
jgi:cytochrome oxidase Cu insertion factor (SCO1/SenC/PrrC family)